MKTRKSNKSLKIFGATSVAIFSLTAVFTATIAWYAANKSVQSESGTITIADLSRLFGKLSFHKYLGKDSSGNLLFDQKAGGFFEISESTHTIGYSGDPSACQMDSYSLTNPRHPLLAIIELNRLVNASNSQFKITAQTSHYYLGDFKNGTPRETLVAQNNPLSSIVRFSTDHYEKLSDIASGTATIEGASYNTYVYANPSDNSWDSFVELTHNGEELVFSNFNQELTIIDSDKFSSQENKKIQYVTMIFDYYDDAINFVYNRYLGNSLLNEEFVHYACDWTLVI